MRIAIGRAFGRKVAILLLPCFLFCAQEGRARQLSAAYEQLQGSWEGEGPPGRVLLTITGTALRLYSRSDFWYEATFTLPSDVEPLQLHATITGSSPPAKDVGALVFAVYKIEGGELTLGVGDGSGEPPADFLDASSQYVLKRTESPPEALDGPH